MAGADVVLAVGAADPVGLARFVRGRRDLLATADGRRVHAVVNRVRASVTGPDPAIEIGLALARSGAGRRVGLVPADVGAADRALVRGLTWADAAPRSRARLALRRFVLGACAVPRSDRRAFEGAPGDG